MSFIAFSHPEANPPLSEVTGNYEWSLDLADWHGSEVCAGGITVTLSAQRSIPAAGTPTDTVPAMIFVRVVATHD